MAQYGLDLVEGRVRNNVEAGVLEPAMSKTKMIQVRGWALLGSCGVPVAAIHLFAYSPIRLFACCLVYN